MRRAETAVADSSGLSTEAGRIDWLLASLEAALRKVEKANGSSVRLTARLFELQNRLQQVRDLMDSNAQHVLGGDCLRIGRIHALDRVRSAVAREADAEDVVQDNIASSCLEACLPIEKVLRDLREDKVLNSAKEDDFWCAQTERLPDMVNEVNDGCTMIDRKFSAENGCNYSRESTSTADTLTAIASDVVKLRRGVDTEKRTTLFLAGQALTDCRGLSEQNLQGPAWQRPRDSNECFVAQPRSQQPTFPICHRAAPLRLRFFPGVKSFARLFCGSSSKRAQMRR